jgi:predicted acylesterase/phospholipase RssA
MSFRNLVISSGAFKGVAVLGCVRCLEERGLLSEIKRFVGTSAGALLSLFLALGFTYKQLRSFVKFAVTDMCAFEFDLDNVFRLFQAWGLDDGEKISQLARLAIRYKLGVSDVDFVELAKATGKHLVVCVTNVSERRREFLDVDRAPRLSVVKAIRMSCSIPFVFTPVSWNGSLYVDGAVYDEFPMDFLRPGERVHDTLGILLQSPKCEARDFFSYFRMLVEAMVAKINDYEDVDSNIVVLKFDRDDYIDTASFSMRVDIGEVEELVRMGYDRMREKLDEIRGAQEAMSSQMLGRDLGVLGVLG